MFTRNKTAKIIFRFALIIFSVFVFSSCQNTLKNENENPQKRENEKDIENDNTSKTKNTIGDSNGTKNCAISFLELENMCTMKISNIEGLLKERGFILKSFKSDNLVITKSYFCGSNCDKKMYDLLQITAPINYETTNKNYQAPFMKKLEDKSYKFIDNVEFNLGGQPVKGNKYSNGEITITIYQYELYHTTYYCYSICNITD